MTDGSLAARVLQDPIAPPAPTALIEACGLPEVGSRLADLSVRIDDGLGCPFVLDGSGISVRPDVAEDLLSVAMVLREAIELDVVRRGPAAWPERIVAHATALRCGATVLRRRVPAGARPMPGVALPDADVVLAGHPRAAAETIAAFLRNRDGTSACPTAAIEAAARALPLARPTDELLTLGGDDRQVVDWDTGVNSYGIAPRPTPWRAAFGSCTASSPTFRAFDAARRLRLALIHAALDDRLDEAIAAEAREMRSTLLAALGIAAEPGTEVVFTPSGTDAEVVALAVALAAGGPLHTVVVGPVEIGRGSSPAARGCHFSSSVPSGRTVIEGATIDGVDGSAITVAEVPVRDEDGLVLAPDEIAAHVDRALDAAPGRVLLHVVEGSKTGIRAPFPEQVDAWESHRGADLDVVVDAAQMRIDQPTVAAHLAARRMIIVTGSKLFGGPPFSGAVLLPPALADRIRAAPPPVTGLADYLSEADVPPGLAGLRAVSRPGANLGLLARWAAALAEMRSFHNASWEIRDEVLRRLAAGMRGTLERADHVEIVESPYSRIPEVDRRGLRDLPTIFTFVIRSRDGALLDVDQARRAQTLLGRDLTTALAAVPGAHQVVARSYHLGQPVKVRRAPDGRWIGALRLAIGAPTVSQVVFDHTRGATWTERIELELSDVRDALDKLRLVVEHLDLR